jgi:uncharacterized protein (TIGR03437 family)
MTSTRLSFLALVLASASAFAQVTLSTSPTRVIGQDNLTISSFNPNLVEGREFDTPLGIALDTSASPPHLYVADTGNNRILGFANASSFSNGQKADIVIGQPDFATTFASGPTSGSNARQTGMTEPVGLAVDSSGNLYVADAGNNRILRFPQPFIQTSILPNMVIGQKDFTTATPNLNGIGANTLALNPGSGALTAYLAFDSSGNLWVADAGNNRVLRFNASALSSGTSNPAADVVIGQANFTSNTAAGYTLQSLSVIDEPTGVAFDSNGNLFVSESLSNQNGRVLVYPAPQFTAEPASRIVGAPTTPPTSLVNNLQIGAGSGAIGVVNNQLLVTDSANNRILIYPPLANWGMDMDSQPASAAIGQADFTSGAANAGQPDPSATSLQSPSALAFSGTELFIADSNNHRVIVMPQSGSTFAAATRVLGQDGFNFGTVNLIEGREFNFTSLSGGLGDAGIVIDSSSTPAHLYVADPYNNRILCYKNLFAAQAGTTADMVIGQPDFQHSDINYPSNAASSPNQSGLNSPTGLALDVNGNLYVADTGNSRVVRFPAPFANPQNLPNADLVIGQQSFTITITDASASTMSAPYGLAFFADNGLLVSDRVHNRVLFFTGSAAQFKSGMAATLAFGQPDFTTTTAGNTAGQLNAPHHISTDSSGRLYVADTFNGRVSIFDVVTNAVPGAQAAIELSGLASPQGVFVNQSTGDIWVTGTQSGAIYQFPTYDNLTLDNLQPNLSLPEQAAPIAITLDASGALYAADSANRVVVYYPGVAGLNAANYLGPCVSLATCNILSSRPLAPGMITALFSLSNGTNPFASGTTSFSTLPVPVVLGDTQVTVNGTPAPLFFVSPSQINFVIPIEAPTSGNATLNVIRVSTGQILGSTLVPMAPASPGLFTLNASGSGQVAAVNQDGSINGQSHPAPWNSIVSLYGTGSGLVPNEPADGVAPTGALSTPTSPQVVIGDQYVPAGNVTYSGLAPGLVGVWQLNVQIPNTVVPTTAAVPTQVFVQFESVFSGGPLFGRAVTMWVSSN